MTATATKPCDVFVSGAATDGEIACEIASSLESAGLQPFHQGLVPSSADLGKAIWEALAECRALIVIFSPEAATYAMGLVELGAAAAWNKPVFVMMNGPLTTKLPAVLRSYPVYPLSRLDEVVRAIQATFEPLTDEELQTLAETYQALNTPADQLSQRRRPCAS